MESVMASVLAKGCHSLCVHRATDLDVEITGRFLERGRSSFGIGNGRRQIAGPDVAKAVARFRSSALNGCFVAIRERPGVLSKQGAPATLLDAMTARSIQPPGWPRPRGYSNGMAARGELLAVAGMIGWDAQERLVSDEFVPQFHQALANVCDVVRAAGGGPEHILSLTIYVTDKQAYIAALREVGEAYRALLGRHYPAMALVQVAGLLEDRAKVEIQALAALPVAPEEEVA